MVVGFWGIGGIVLFTVVAWIVGHYEHSTPEEREFDREMRKRDRRLRREQRKAYEHWADRHPVLFATLAISIWGVSWIITEAMR